MPPTKHHPSRAETLAHRRRPARLRLLPAEHPARQTPKPLGIANDGPPQESGCGWPTRATTFTSRGVTGVGKSHLAGQPRARRSRRRARCVLLDCQGDLARHVLDRLPASAGDRLVILDPAETEAPPAWNVLAPLDPDQPHETRERPARHRDRRPDHGTVWREGETGREWAAENVVGVFAALYAAWWGRVWTTCSAPPA